MRQSQLLKITGGTRNELDGGRRREVLPITPRDTETEDAAWLDYSLRDAVMLRPYFDLTRAGLRAEDVSSFILNGVDRIERGTFDRVDDHMICLSEPRPLLGRWDDEIWIAREIWTCPGIGKITGGERDFSVTWHGGTRDEITSSVAFAARGFEDRETLSLQLYNLTAARAKVFAAARALSLPELAEVAG
ncbi:hypothetical protein [Paracoccus sp. NSM]|uniref:hypothetical protein n=1 Tax=Paracoccus sp. NSM TaxID=3457784 RepID=UPI0040363688